MTTPNQPTHALFYIDNSYGDKTPNWTFAYREEGLFYHFDCNRPVIEYKGDEIIKIVTLDESAIEQPERKRIVQEISNEGLILNIPAEYLENSFAMGVTTNVTGTVTDRVEMLEYFANEFNSLEGDSKFGRFIDAVCEEAIDQGELFVECDDEE